MKTIRELRLSGLLQACRENLANSENAILNLYSRFEAGQIQANKAKKEFAVLIKNFEIDFKRCNSIAKVVIPDFNEKSKDYNIAYWIAYYKYIFA